MENINFIDIAVVAIYFLIVIYIGVWAMKKVKDFDDYAVAGRGMPMPIFFAAIAATICGGGATIGRISFMHQVGFVVVIALFGTVFCQLFSGCFIAKRVHAIKNVYSIGDLFGFYYGKSGRLISSIMSILFCLGFFGVQILAMGAILQTATGMPLLYATVFSSAITLAYTWSGGMLGVTMTDAIQYVIIIIGVSVCGYIGIEKAGGFDAMMTHLMSAPDLVTHMSFTCDWSPVQIFGLFLGFLLGEFCAPYVIQRYASTKSGRDGALGLCLFSVHYIFFIATTAGIGLASLALQPNVEPGLAFTTFVRDVLPAGVVGLLMAALLAAVMSSGAAFINTACVIYTRDIYHRFINTSATQGQLLKQTRMSTLIVGAIAIPVAISFNDVFGLMVYIYKLWPSTVIPPLLCGLLWGRISPYAGAPAMLLGGLSFFIWSDKCLMEPLGIPANLVGIAVNCLVLLVVHTMMHRAPTPKTGIYAPENL